MTKKATNSGLNGHRAMPGDKELQKTDPQVTMGILLLDAKLWIAIRGVENRIVINKSTTTDEPFLLIGHLLVRDRQLREKILSFIDGPVSVNPDLVQYDPEKDDPKKLGALLLQAEVYLALKIEEKGFTVYKSTTDDRAFTLIVHLLIHSLDIRGKMLAHIKQNTKFEI